MSIQHLTPKYSQAHRPIQVLTPLNRVATPQTYHELLAVGFTGREGISQLFHFTIDVLSEKGKEYRLFLLPLLGEPVTVRLQMPGSKHYRCFSGICRRITQGAQDRVFTAFSWRSCPSSGS